jgi:hypothetical protein
MLIGAEHMYVGLTVQHFQSYSLTIVPRKASMVVVFRFRLTPYPSGGWF